MDSYDYKNAVTLFQDCFKRIATKQGIDWNSVNDTAVEVAIDSLIDEIIDRIEENKKTEDSQSIKRCKEDKNTKYTLEDMELIFKISKGKSPDLFLVYNDCGHWNIAFSSAPKIDYYNKKLCINFWEQNYAYKRHTVPISELGKTLFTNIKDAKRALNILKEKGENEN